MSDDVRTLIEDAANWLVARLTPEGSLLRGVWVVAARYSIHARLWLFLRDTWEIMQGDHVPGEVVMEWADGRSAQSMAEQIVEHVRRAPRAYGVTRFVLEAGERGHDPAMMSGMGNDHALATVTQFLTANDPKRQRVVRLLLLGQTLAAVKQHYGWSA